MKNKVKPTRINTTIKGRDQLRNKSRSEAAADKVDQYPWAEWEHEFMTERNSDGTWKYQSLKDFATQKEINYDHLKITCSSYPRDGYTYRGDWGAMRNGRRWKLAPKRAADAIAKLDRAERVVEMGNVTLEECDRQINFGNRIGEDFEAFFQGQSLQSNSIYQSKLSRSPKIRKQQIQDRNDDLERFTMFMSVAERVQRFISKWIDRRNHTMEILANMEQGAMRGGQYSNNKSMEKVEGQLIEARELTPQEVAALKYYAGGTNFSTNYDIDLPGLNKAVEKPEEVEAKKPVTVEMVHVGRSSE